MAGNDAWAEALDEAESPERRDRGLWARCFAEADGDEAKAKAAYVKARVQDGAHTPVTPAPAEPPPRPTDGYCPNCGSACYLDAKTCPECGAFFSPEGQDGWRPLYVRPDDAVSPPPKRLAPTPSPIAPPAARAEEKASGSSWWKWLLGVPVGGFLLLLIIGSCTSPPDSSSKAGKRAVIDLCWEDQKRKSLDPGTARFVASTCERLEAEFQQQFGHRP